MNICIIYFLHIDRNLNNLLEKLCTFDECRLNENAPDPSTREHILARGQDSWVGRAVQKDFGQHGIFRGQVTDVDDNSSKAGYRVFHVEYADGDDEWMGAEDLLEILLVCCLVN